MVVIAIGVVIAAAMSLAALVDPFDWYPSFEALWADCDDDYGTSLDECAYDVRFPGFWWHLVANLGYAIASVVALLIFAGAVGELRECRSARLEGARAYGVYTHAVGVLALATAAVVALAVLPILVGAL